MTRLEAAAANYRIALANLSVAKQNRGAAQVALDQAFELEREMQREVEVKSTELQAIAEMGEP